jgi:hypothetical protein
MDRYHIHPEGFSWRQLMNMRTNTGAFRQQLFDFLRYPQRQHAPGTVGSVREAAEWLADNMRRGIENVAVVPTEGHPIVYGDWLVLATMRLPS